jgi:hypothetical protein
MSKKRCGSIWVRKRLPQVPGWEEVNTGTHAAQKHGEGNSLSAETHRWRFPVLAVTPGLTRAMLTYMSIGKNVVMYKM